MVPIDGEVREGVGPAGLAQLRDPADGRARQQLRRCATGDELRRRLRAKNRHNAVHDRAVPAGRGGSHFFALTVLGLGGRRTCTGVSARRRSRLAVVAQRCCSPSATSSLVERAVAAVPARCARSAARSTTATSGGTSASGSCVGRPYLQLLQRHPVQERLWRLLGVRIGRGSSTTAATSTERTLVTIGDDCTLNAGSIDPVPLAGGRRLQVRPQHDRRRLHARGRRLRPLRRDDGRRRGARRRLLPDEGRGSARRRAVGRQPGHGDARASAATAGPRGQRSTTTRAAAALRAGGTVARPCRRQGRRMMDQRS